MLAGQLTGLVVTILSSVTATPVNVVRSPDQSVWLIDEGKIGGTGQHKGGAIRYQPSNGNSLAIE